MELSNMLSKEEKEYYDVVGAPIKGEAVPSAEVNDPTFAEEMLGKGMAIKPTEGKVYAPFEHVYPQFTGTIYTSPLSIKPILIIWCFEIKSSILLHIFIVIRLKKNYRAMK